MTKPIINTEFSIGNIITILGVIGGFALWLNSIGSRLEVLEENVDQLGVNIKIDIDELEGDIEHDIEQLGEDLRYLSRKDDNEEP